MLLLLLLIGPKVDSENTSTLQVLLRGSLLKTRAVSPSAGLMTDETHQPTLTANIHCMKGHSTKPAKRKYTPGKLANLPSILAQWSQTRHT